jgi:hypothetical protein
MCSLVVEYSQGTFSNQVAMSLTPPHPPKVLEPNAPNAPKRKKAFGGLPSNVVSRVLFPLDLNAHNDENTHNENDENDENDENNENTGMLTRVWSIISSSPPTQ